MKVLAKYVSLLTLLFLVTTVVAQDDYDAVLAWIEQNPADVTLASGSILNQGNAAIAQLLPPGYVEEFDFPDAKIEIAAPMNFKPHPIYEQASAKYADTATLSDDGALQNYVAGRPFSPQKFDEVSPSIAGLMIAWNHIHRWQYYGWHSGELVMNYLVPTTQGGTLNDGLTGGGHVERFVVQNYHRVYLSHLAMLPENDYRAAVDGASKYLYKDYIEFQEPFDVQGTKFVVERMLDPKEPDQVNSYMPGERRVRRLSARERADRFMGTDLTMDDFEGFSGQVLDYSWRYLGKRKMLAVADSREPLISFFGPKSRVPDEQWQVRETYAVEIVPSWDGHPYASKILFIDAQTWNVALALAFNRDKQLWRIFNINYWLPDTAKGSEPGLGDSVPHWAATVAIDALADTATVSRAIVPTELPKMKASQIRRRFSVSNLTSGR